MNWTDRHRAASPSTPLHWPLAFPFFSPLGCLRQLCHRLYVFCVFFHRPAVDECIDATYTAVWEFLQWAVAGMRTVQPAAPDAVASAVATGVLSLDTAGSGWKSNDFRNRSTMRRKGNCGPVSPLDPPPAGSPAAEDAANAGAMVSSACVFEGVVYCVVAILNAATTYDAVRSRFQTTEWVELMLQLLHSPGGSPRLQVRAVPCNWSACW